MSLQWLLVIKYKLAFSKILLVVIPSQFWGHLRLHSVYVENLIQSDVVATCLSSGIRLLHIQLHVFHQKHVHFLDFRSEKKYVPKINYLVKTRMNMGEERTHTNLKFISHIPILHSKTTVIKKLCKILSNQGVVIMKRSQILGLQRIFNMSTFSMILIYRNKVCGLCML